jgi:hypothetical protein
VILVLSMQKQKTRLVELCVASCGRTRCVQLADGGLVEVKQAADDRILVSVDQRHHQSSAKSAQTSLDKHHMELIDHRGTIDMDKHDMPFITPALSLPAILRPL